MKYVALAVVGGATGFLIARLLFPLVLDRGGLAFLVLPIVLIATLLLARAFRGGRAGL